jgi:protein-tyrosine phosphatase
MYPEIYMVEDAEIGIMPRPRGNDWLADEMAALREAGVDVLVSMLTGQEAARLGLENEKEVAENAGMTFLSLPIIDHTTPSDAPETYQTIQQIADLNAAGQTVVCHCFAGIGRSATIAACVLVLRGYSATQAMDMLSEARGFAVPETLDQEDWVRAFASKFS